MTWNIAAGHGDIAQIAETIRGSGADVIALQEVDVRWSDRSAFVDQADSLAKSLHMEVRFAPIYSIEDSTGMKPPRQFGVALLSRYPITGFANHSITRHSTQQATSVPSLAPGFLAAMIDVKGRKIRVFSTHLDYRQDPAVRRQQVAEMLEIIGQSSTPAILGGDLNAEPRSSELEPLLRTMHDVWPPSAGTGLTYPANAPVKRIDYVLTSSGFTVTSAQVLQTQASDHRPVIMDLMMPVSPLPK
jgi:endonuclease/exonuclease/phosphatase family metal-dependent hydrolase